MNTKMNTIGIDNNLDRDRIRKLLAIGLFASIMTGVGDFLLGYAEEIDAGLIGPNDAIGPGIGTTFLSCGNAFMFGGLLVTLPGEEKFLEFKGNLVRSIE